MISIFKLSLKDTLQSIGGQFRLQKGNFFLHGVPESVPQNPRANCDFTFLNCILERRLIILPLEGLQILDWPKCFALKLLWGWDKVIFLICALLSLLTLFTYLQVPWGVSS